jgi:hypothetical protein
MGGAGAVRSCCAWRVGARWLSRELDAATELRDATAVCAGAWRGSGGVGLDECGGGGGGVPEGGVPGAVAGGVVAGGRDDLLGSLELLRAI